MVMQSRVLLLCLLATSVAVGADADLGSDFARPLPEYSPVPIWWWSGDPVTQDGIRDQLAKIAAGGIHNAIVLNLAPSGPLYGSAPDEPPFLSEEWWDLFTFAVEEGKRVGVRLWFYDQFGFSGAGLQARVVRDHPEFRGVSLGREVRNVTGSAEVEIPTPTGGTPLAAFVAEVAEAPGQVAQWIWDRAAPEGTVTRYFRRVFEVAAVPKRAHLNITADNGYIAHVNGVKLGEESIYGSEGWGQAERLDMAPHLRKGKNVVAVAAENLGGPGGVLAEIVLDDRPAESGEAEPAVIVTDHRFRMSAEAPEGWTHAEFDDAAWTPAGVLGALPLEPWGSIAGIESGAATALGTRIQNVRNVSGEIEDGVLRVSVPEGSHLAELFYTTPGGFDYLNPAAGAALLEVVHGEIERRLGHELGKGIAGSFQDEFPAVPRYSALLPDTFRQRAGYDLLDKLPALYDDVIDHFGTPDGPDTIQVRCDASRVAAEMAEAAFFKPLFDWHERYGMLCGYDQTCRNADPLRGEAYYVDYFKTMRHYSVPGNDMDGEAKPHQSIADLYGRPRVWLEGFHSSGWGQTIEDTATLLHPWVAEGSTLLDPHAIYYSIHGSYWEWAPPDTGWRQPYFAHYPVFADYVSRLCYVLSQGTHVVQVAVVHPASTVHAYAGFTNAAGAAQQAKNCYWAVQSSLRGKRIDYIIIDEDSLARADVTEGALCVSGLELRVIVLPGTRVLTDKTLAVLRRFADSGGTLIIVGAPPEAPAGNAASRQAFAETAEDLKAMARTLEAPSQIAQAVGEVLPRDTVEKVPVLHRRIGNRQFYFVLADQGTLANGHARYAVNDRKLWETPTGRGLRASFTFNADGIPEFWDALTGEVTPIHNYLRADKHTRVDVGLGRTPAPLIALRPATPEDPMAIESELDVTACERAGDVVTLRGLPRADAAATGEHVVRVTFADRVYEGSAPAAAPHAIEIPGPFACRLEPTCDNADGSFAWPPSDGPIPIEVRSVRFHEEGEGDDPAQWAQPDFDDSTWQTVIASFGPRAEWAGPLKLAEGQTFDSIGAPPAEAGPFKPMTYSLRLGISEDPVFRSALGGKGRIPEEFLEVTNTHAGEVYLLRALVTVPEKHDAVPATLRVGGVARKRAFLNGGEVQFSGDPAARVLRAAVTLQPGANRLELLASRSGNGRLRLYYQFLATESIPPDPEWIWSVAANETGTTTFAKTLEIPGSITSASMIVALGDLHKIRINGKLLADQGNFDPYFTSRAERYDIASFLKTGANRIEIEARDHGHPVGLLLDGLVVLEDGREITFVSDTSFATAPDTPARILPGPARGYMGDPATLLLRPRPHPLPFGGWLLDQPPWPAPFDKLVYSISDTAPPPGWFRFRVPPGATAMALATPGEVALYVNGHETPVVQAGSDRVTAQLPEPDAPVRTAALRIQSIAGFEQGAALLGPMTFEVGQGAIPLGSWDELGLPHYCGGMHYVAEVPLHERGASRIILDLGRVRGSADVMVNGVPCGTRVWHPYRFDITEAVKAGPNQIDIRIFNTLGPHFAIGHPGGHVFKNHTVSGLFGPVSVNTIEPVEVKLRRATQNRSQTP